MFCTQTPDGMPQLCLGADGATTSFMEIVKLKRGGKRKSGSDQAIMKAYLTYHSKCFRREGGKDVNGAYVENEIIAAVAKQNGIIIQVAERRLEKLQFLTPQGTFMRIDEAEVEQTPFFLWCTGGHYQAIVRLCDVEVISTALSQASFKEGNVLSCDDIRTPQ